MITVEHLTKCYGDFLAVDDLSFEIEEGHVYGFLGPNGAGKSTLMKCMFGIYHMDQGEIFYEGQPVHIKDPLDACPPQAGVCASTGTTFSRSPARPSGSSATCRSSRPSI